jgi:hypothetical protein
MLLYSMAGTANAVACADDSEVAARAAREVRQPASDFVWAQLRELADLYERRYCEESVGHWGLKDWLGSQGRTGVRAQLQYCFRASAS